MKNNIIRIILFLTIVIVPPTLWLGLKMSGSDLYARVQFDLGEKRELTSIDDVSDLLTDGTLLNDFYADRAPFRSLIISLNRKVDGKIEKPYENKILPLAMKLYNKNFERGTEGNTALEADINIKSEEAFEDLFSDGNNEITTENEFEQNTTESSDENTVDEVIEHDYELIYYYPATCQYDGLSRFKCRDCGDEYEEISKRFPHDPFKLWDVEASYEDCGYELYVCSICAQSLKMNMTDKLIDDSYLAPTIKNNEVIIGRSGWLFLAGDGNLAYYTRENVLSDAEMQEYADVLTELNNVCKEHGKQLAVIVAPAKEQVYSEYMPSFTFASVEKRTQKLVAYISDHTDVAITYPFNELKYASRYWYTYYKCDTHWNNLGAYVGYQALLKQLGCKVTSPFDVRTLENDYPNNQDLISLGGLDANDYPSEKDYRVDYRPITQVTSLYEGDWSIMTYYQTLCEEGNGKKLFLAGDSYRINMIPYLSKDFSKCTFVYKGNIAEGAEELVNADVIVIEAVERMDFEIANMARTLTELIKQQK